MASRAVGLIANAAKRGAAELVPQIAAALRERGMEVRCDPDTAPLLSDAIGESRTELAARCELLLVLGGDGTLLETAHELAGNAPPVFGINVGTLGFLTSVGAAAWQKAVDCIASGKCRVEERTLLRVELRVGGETILVRYALNDAVISRGERSQLIRLNVHVDGAGLSQYNADGLIIATPTGSTAYALSAGGPVMTPDSGVFVIAPICPHVLTMRPVVVSDQSRIEISAIGEAPDVLLSIDGEHHPAVTTDTLIILSKADRKVRLATLPDTTFFDVLRQKLKWSGTAV
jgi:NAD+ kinase